MKHSLALPSANGHLTSWHARPVPTRQQKCQLPSTLQTISRLLKKPGRIPWGLVYNAAVQGNHKRRGLRCEQTLALCLLAFLALGGSLLAADPFVGTWKLNVAKTKWEPTQPGMAPTEETIVIQVTSEQYVLITKGKQENGSAISLRLTQITLTAWATCQRVARTSSRGSRNC
jgi:hypothetical protein